MANKLAILEHLRSIAVSARTYTLSKISELSRLTTEALDEMSKVKADKSKSTAYTIQTTGWKKSSLAKYTYYYDIPVSEATANDKATVTILPDSADTASACELCPTNQTLAGVIRIWAVSTPAKAISCEYWIEQGKEN